MSDQAQLPQPEQDLRRTNSLLLVTSVVPPPPAVSLPTVVSSRLSYTHWKEPTGMPHWQLSAMS